MRGWALAAVAVFLVALSPAALSSAAANSNGDNSYSSVSNSDYSSTGSFNSTGSPLSTEALTQPIPLQQPLHTSSGIEGGAEGAMAVAPHMGVAYGEGGQEMVPPVGSEVLQQQTEAAPAAPAADGDEPVIMRLFRTVTDLFMSVRPRLD
ncbi:uncharacterized protein EMH_0007410 [Eimeria mitis]|uniref:Uncharacterized protein n=1 Tax=Eimeria mitis TaxID=44415 RepID=U6KH29_9EIME|nr:uncharacterized protein EMH_0007410 [Eimeria mitis]CDJ36091.1 hypothetical protein, conserved [Eimeria mitis]